MEKRGIGHIEIILSFMIFIVAVGFGLYFFNTGDSTRLVDSTLTYAFREIEENTTALVTIYSVDLSEEKIGVVTTIALDFPGVEGRARVVNYEGQKLDSSRSGSLVFVHSNNFANDAFLFVMFGEEFQDDSVLPVEHNSTYYQIGSSETKDVISEAKFIELRDIYASDYGGLKGQGNFNLPDRIDFGFSLFFDDGQEIVAEKNIPDNFEVFSERKRLEVLKESGDIVFADLVVKVW
jgi:hypothetical protein